MEFKEIQELIKLVNNIKVSIRSKAFAESKFSGQSVPQIVPMQVPTASAAVPIAAAPAAVVPTETPAASTETKAAPAAKEDDTSGLVEVKSPIVGTFYRSQSPDKPAFAKVGDVIQPGDVICIVEAMKLFNEIESEQSGKIVKVLVEDATPIEFDQPLFLIDPKG